MLTGHYDRKAGRPQIEGYVEIRSLGVRGFVFFLIDTGADCTVLMPADAKRLNVDYSKIGQTAISLGSSGPGKGHVCPATTTFGEAGVGTYTYDVSLRLPEPKPELLVLPSLLGRDVLNRWRLSMQPDTRTIIIDPINWDIWRSLADNGV